MHAMDSAEYLQAGLNHALALAASDNNPDACRKIVAAGADPAGHTRSGGPVPLLAACKALSCSALAYFSEIGCDFSAYDIWVGNAHPVGAVLEGLHVNASGIGHSEKQAALDALQCINIVLCAPRPASSSCLDAHLPWAIDSNSHKAGLLASVLLDAGADPNAPFLRYGKTENPLSVALGRKDPGEAAVRALPLMLSPKLAKPSDSLCLQALEAAFLSGNPGLVRAVYQKRPDLPQTKGFNPLSCLQSARFPRSCAEPESLRACLAEILAIHEPGALLCAGASPLGWICSNLPNQTVCALAPMLASLGCDPAAPEPHGCAALFISEDQGLSKALRAQCPAFADLAEASLEKFKLGKAAKKPKASKSQNPGL